ncbi:hypothetical protein BW686_13880 [Pseudomonas syringae]|uniref:Type 1 fimbrial protein n=1 Tax=Pseudomonas syringae TaxID=317 RepID=A0A244ER43_PSESX|nr:hypothetical protein [Pseudomonas syringae]MCI3944080.1 hypothetical protein [Pseudomonas syringae]OUM07013.1 hypothetical protein BW686_13880 [Pseudomonas syringae]
MRSEKSCRKGVLKTLPRLESVWAALVMLPLMVAPSVSLAKDGVLSLHGSVVNSSCRVSYLDANPAAGHTRSVEVAPGIKVHVSTDYNACGAQAVPFVAHFQRLPAAPQPDGTSSPSRTALITLNYQ